MPGCWQSGSGITAAPGNIMIRDFLKSRAGLLFAASAVAAIGLFFVARSQSTDRMAQRVCASRYSDARTQPDTLAIDSARFVGRNFERASRICGEFRAARLVD